MSYGMTMASGTSSSGARADLTERRAGGSTLDGLLLRNLLSASSTGIAFYDQELRCLRINEPFAEIRGISVEDHLGRTMEELRQHGNGADVLEQALRAVLATGEPQLNFEVRRCVWAVLGDERCWLVSCYPVRDDRKKSKMMGIGALAIEITERKRAEAERERLLREVTASAERQRRFVREMLAGVTGGRLSLCDSAADLPKPLPKATDVVPLSVASLRYMRQDIRAVGSDLGFDPPRWQDLETAAGEATMNAVVHAGGGQAWICTSGSNGDRIQVWVKDNGNGIAEERLHRATLERGFTTAGTLGHGFWMMLQTADRTFLLTGPKGTTVVLEQNRDVPPPLWFQTL